MEADINGVEWDSSLHNPNQEKKADGTWKNRPGGVKVPRESQMLESKSRERKERIPPGAPRMKLSADLPEGYRGYWAPPSMFEELLDGGYTFVNKNGQDVGSDKTDGDSLGSYVSRVVNRKTGERHYLLAIREEWYQENQAAAQSALDGVESQINNPSGEGMYAKNPFSKSPESGNKITHGNG